ncbi:preprotein translocase subunit SecG [Candidatus Parcubacteria bacterium]|nr:preprotein translocase subunit SecG [Candidatus Parcubacteria bacterium]
MNLLIGILQIIVSILLIGAVLLQQRGTGLSSAFGGDGNVYRTKRGLEKIIFIATIVLAAVFIVLAASQLLFQIS